MFNESDIETYFNAEKAESRLFLLMGIAAVITGLIALFWLRTPFFRGAALPLLGVGLLMGIVGYTVYQRSDADRKRNVYAYTMNPGQIQSEEIPRMQKVMNNFVIYRWVEILLAIGGMVLFLYYRDDATKQYWKGLGAGLALMALMALAADYFAEKRGRIYLDGLKLWVQSKGGS